MSANGVGCSAVSRSVSKRSRRPRLAIMLIAKRSRSRPGLIVSGYSEQDHREVDRDPGVISAFDSAGRQELADVFDELLEPPRGSMCAVDDHRRARPVAERVNRFWGSARRLTGLQRAPLPVDHQFDRTVHHSEALCLARVAVGRGETDRGGGSKFMPTERSAPSFAASVTS